MSSSRSPGARRHRHHLGAQTPQAGRSVEVVGPFGEFHIHDTPATMICVAGGSGMAPLKSMIHHMHETGAFPEKEIWYFFGARTQKDMFYLEELSKLASSWPRFHFVPALSEQPTQEEGWQGEVGLITDVLDRYLQGRIETNPRGSRVTSAVLRHDQRLHKCHEKNAMAEEKIYFDKFA
jgi:Na+-transporting NADH:ubiquinone oxidoreductase subunit F